MIVTVRIIGSGLAAEIGPSLRQQLPGKLEIGLGVDIQKG
jgi:hypothetical protein